jgi:hypothetical protein
MGVRRSLVGVVGLGFGLGCSEVEVFDRFEPLAGVIEGTVVIRTPELVGSECQQGRRGDVILSLFRVEDPPPPEGTGESVSFVVVPEARVFGEGDGVDVRGAPFVFASVPTGRYTIRGFVDVDGDFNPVFDLTGQPTAFDVGGGVVDPDTGAFTEVEVTAGRVTRNVVASLGRVVPVERPAFVPTATSADVPGRLELAFVALDRGPVQVEAACGGFAVELASEDGVPRDRDGDGLVDVFPRVLFTRDEMDGSTTVVPGVVDPLPFLDRLVEGSGVRTDILPVVLPPAAFVRPENGGDLRPLERVPAGPYQVSVLSGTGQTWSVPNEIDTVDPPDPDLGPTRGQVEPVRLNPALPAGEGRIDGRVRVPAEPAGSTYVFAFAVDDPPPPAGTGQPRAVTRVEGFVPDGGGFRAAGYRLSGLPEGDWIVQGLQDLDGDFSPLVDLRAQPSAGDRVGRIPAAVTVRMGRGEAPELELNDLVPFDRPFFSMEELRVEQSELPVRLRLDARSVLGSQPGLPVQLAGTDAEGDGLPDLLPRVLLTRLAPSEDPRVADDVRGAPVWLGWVDPVPFLVPLSTGQPAISAPALDVLLLPVAVGPDGSPLGPPPPGRYRVNLVAGTGQTWSVPNDLDLQLGRVGTPREDPGQAAVVRLDAGASPPGAIRVQVELPAGLTPPFRVALAARPAVGPLGPLAPPASSVVLTPADFEGGSGEVVLPGLPSGLHVVTGFIDLDENFAPFLPSLAQPTRSDRPGGVVGGDGRPVPVQVDALDGPPEVTARFGPPLTDDPPVFTFDPQARIGPAGGTVTLHSVAHASSLWVGTGRFVVRWVDADGDGQADDVTGDGAPDVYPLVVAEPLEASGGPVFGQVDPGQFSGFPAARPDRVDAAVVVDRVDVFFPPSEAVPGAEPGVHRIAVVNPTGQRWAVPNELSAATGTDLTVSQSPTLRFVSEE